jgi:D-psicose/D-tagatose/L-ribulose 3-epimerase
MPNPFRYAICNEVYQDWSFADACRSIARAGYAGIELAPFTLGDDPPGLPAGKRREYRATMQSEGLAFVGLHWLLVGPKGIHVTTPDREIRERSWAYVRGLIDLCADLGEGGVMVFGSPDGRRSTGGSTREEATRRFAEGFAGLAPHAAARGVTLLVEALSPAQCDVVQSLAEAAAIVESIGSPAVQTMFDTHNAIAETEPHAALIERYYHHIRHIHVNELDGSHPGAGSYDFKPVMDTLLHLRYQGWVSVEAFDLAYGGEQIASESLRRLEAARASAAA